ncbi:hypothetical protein CONPUDRAFT_135351 [Coniophora puteana RWD-64-598 SS2]|uniref:DUF6593 domain-containing protein n=1 Tax=Coniophora puteana (strain RWD-64-598) TaxID=741705 RepID=A0A5M3N4B1_CONPW|nr:uncharacterized protein CONPUDRAFT_135351 [Coniophora puteana RWD-64-598 SS2]EIW85741.1 hypothetical protein CONPUDRAFT_135351 [Coniophora puteana RWD-64-598 SS2]
MRSSSVSLSVHAIASPYAKPDASHASTRHTSVPPAHYTLETRGMTTFIHKRAAMGSGNTLLAAIERNEIMPDEITLWLDDDERLRCGRPSLDTITDSMLSAAPGDDVRTLGGAEEVEASSKVKVEGQRPDAELASAPAVLYGPQAGGRRMKLSKWLRAPRFASFPVSFEVRGETYEWREDASGQLVLYHPRASPSALPLARFSAPTPENQSTHGAHLALQTALAEDEVKRDAVLISFVALEQKRRMRLQAQNRGRNNGVRELQAVLSA